MQKRMKFGLATAGSLLIAGTAAADLLLYDITRDGRDAWEAALAEKGKIFKSGYDLTAQFGDPGIVGLDGPVILGDGPKTVDSNLNPWGEGGKNGRGAGGSGLVLIGVSAGFGNTDTTIAANYFVDSFDIIMKNDDKPQTAAEFTATSLLGSNTVDITVYGMDNQTVIGQWTGLDAGAVGHTYGIIWLGDHDEDIFGRINIYDPQGGAEGITGRGAFWTIPAPGALALLGVAGLVGRRRRR